MSDQAKENHTYEERPALWRLERGKEQRHGRTPALRSLSNGDRRACQTPRFTQVPGSRLQSTNSTPFSNPSSSGVSKGSFPSRTRRLPETDQTIVVMQSTQSTTPPLVDHAHQHSTYSAPSSNEPSLPSIGSFSSGKEKDEMRRPSYMQPTKASCRKSMGSGAKTNLPPASKISQRQTSRLISKCVPGGFLSQPAMRANQRRDNLAPNLAKRDKDTSQHDDDDDEHSHHSIRSNEIYMTSPHLPDITPLSFPTSCKRKSSYPRHNLENSSSLPGSGTKKTQYTHENTMDPSKADEEPFLELKDDDDVDDDEDSSGDKSNRAQTPNDEESNEAETDHGDNVSFAASTSGNESDDDVHTSDDARNDFSEPNVSFELDFSGVDENSYSLSRFSRERSRSRPLTILLPVPSLRNDLPDDNSISSKVVSLENWQDETSPPFGQSKPTTTMEDTPNRPSTNNFLKENSSEQSALSPLETTTPLSASLPDVTLPKSVENCGNQEDSDLLLPLSKLQLDLVSPVTENPPLRRRRQPPRPPVMERKGIHHSRADSRDTDSYATASPESSEMEENECQAHLDSIPLVKHKDRHVLTSVPEEVHDTNALQVLQEQLAQALKENREQAERLARYHRSYEDRVTPFRNLFEEWREARRKLLAAEQQNALVEEIQGKVTQALQQSYQKCQRLEAQLEALKERNAELE